MPDRTANNLCLHYVDPTGARRLALTPDGLRDAVEREHAQGRTAASLGDYLADRAPDASRFTLSFDDAHRSVLTHAMPVLRALGVAATLFVPTAYVGGSDEFLDWDGLRALRDAGWSIGSHTVSHPRMSQRFYREDHAAYQARLSDECSRSRERLERELGIEVSLFAYPYGEAPKEAREAVRRAGYRAAFTVSDALAWDGDVLGIPRVDGLEATGHIVASGGEPTAISVIVPACDRVEILGEIVRRLGAQSYPSERFEVLVVDDGSRASLAPALADAPPNVRLIESPRDGASSAFRAGQARQRGADAARFDTLAFLDADVAVGRDFLWHLDWIHRRTPRAVVLGYLSGYNLHDLGHVHALDDVRSLEELDGALAIIPDRSREPTLRACLDNVDWLDEPWRLAYTGNLSLPRALLNEVGGFARDFVGWGLEDLDLGYRLHRAGARYVFSRFAVGYHLLDAHEGPSRNPFRHEPPSRERFDGYLANLARVESRYPDDPAIVRFAAQSRLDVDETCGHPDTVGIELGGDSPLAPVFHRRLHHCQPGGVATHEALDRVAYARKAGARQLYLVGGDAAVHPGFLDVLRAARAAGIGRIIAETTALPFADASFAHDARDAGLDHAVIEVYSFDRATFAAVAGVDAARFDAFKGGFDEIGRAGIHRSARVIVDSQTIASLDATLSRLRDEQIDVDELVVVEPALRDRAVQSAPIARIRLIGT